MLAALERIFEQLDVTTPYGWEELASQIDALSGWQPIATAPKDGKTDVVLYWDKHAVSDVGCWIQGAWEMNGSGWAPTHWMPLPSAPAQKHPA